MKYLKFYEYLETDIRYIIQHKDQYLDKIWLNAKNGILPKEIFNTKANFLRFCDYLSREEKSIINNAEKKAKEIKNFNENREYILDIIKNSLENNIPIKKSIKEEFPNMDISYIFKTYLNKEDSRKIVLDVVIKGLEKNVSLKDTMKKEFPIENIDYLLSILTDDDKQLINSYHKEMSNKPENMKTYNHQKVSLNKYNNSVTDPTELFSDSLPYLQYSDKIRKLNDN